MECKTRVHRYVAANEEKLRSVMEEGWSKVLEACVALSPKDRKSISDLMRDVVGDNTKGRDTSVTWWQ